MITIEWSREQCEAYRTTITERMNRNATMVSMMTSDDLAFLARQPTPAPYTLYKRTQEGGVRHYNMKEMKEAAFQQIGVCCGSGEPMSLDTVRRDFSLESEWNHGMPETSTALFIYVSTHAESLVDEMCNQGLLERITLIY